MGRFAGEDWVKGDIGSLSTLNSYGYCYGNLEKYVDLDGKLPTIPIGAGLGATFGFIGGITSEMAGVFSGNQKNINWNNVLVDTTSGLAIGAMAGTGVGIGYILAGGMAVGAGNYVAKVAANGEFKSKSWQEHIVDGAISSVVWGVSVYVGGTMQKEVQELKEISGVISKGVVLCQVLNQYIHDTEIGNEGHEEVSILTKELVGKYISKILVHHNGGFEVQYKQL